MNDLSKKVRWYIAIRWYFLVTLAIAGIIPQLINEGSTVRVRRNLIGVGLAIALNGALYLLARRAQKKSALQSLAIIQLSFDLLLGTYILHVQGGIESRTVILYAIPIMVAGALLRKNSTYLVAGASTLLYVGVTLAHRLGIISPTLVFVPELQKDNGFYVASIFFYCAVFFVLASISNFITDLLTSQQKDIEKTNEELKTAQRIARIGSWEWDIKTNKVTWSDELYNLFGIDKKDREQNTYEGYLDLVHPEDKEKVDKVVKESYNTGESFSFDHRILHHNNKITVLHAEGQVLRDKDGKPFKMFGTAQDITDRVESEAKLNTRTEELEEAKSAIVNVLEDLKEEKTIIEAERTKDEAILASIGEGLIFVDNQADITEINDSALELFKAKRKDVIGKKLTNIITLIDKDNKPVAEDQRPIFRTLETGKTVAEGAVYRLKDGSTLPVYLTASAVKVSGKILGAVMVFRDITKEMELQAAKDDFVSLASHQLRTPASAVKNFIGLLKEGYAGKLTKEQSEYVEQAYISNERQLEIINDLLYVARTESGQLVLDKVSQDVRKLVEAAAKEEAQGLRERKQKLTVKEPSKPLMATFDGEYLKMAVGNLINNASKYSPDGSTITISLDGTPKRVEVSVADKGVGIHKEEFDKLFKKFSRLANKMSSRVPGSGIGLYLVKQIMDLHGGSVKVKSDPGKGSVFTISLPLSKKE